MTTAMLKSTLTAISKTLTMFCVCCTLLYWHSIYSQNYFSYAPKRKNFRLYRTDKIVPRIFIITPTKQRHVQMAELTRLSHTLRLVPYLHWILIEDGKRKNWKIRRLLRKSNITFTHLYKLSPPPSQMEGRGMIQRDEGIRFLRTYLNITKMPGVLYFADDDNVYDLELFEKMRYIKKVGVWSVGFVGGLMVEGPKTVMSNGTLEVQQFESQYAVKSRRFAIDMAGFAVNVNLIVNNSRARFTGVGCTPTLFEDCFLRKLNITLKELEPVVAYNEKNKLKDILVWHTRTQAVKEHPEEFFFRKFKKKSKEGWNI